MLVGFKNYLVKSGKADLTVKNYVILVRNYIDWYEEKYQKRMERMERSDVMEYIAYLKDERKFMPATINSYLARLQSFNEYLIKAGIQTELVLTRMDRVEWPGGHTTPPSENVVTIEELRHQALKTNVKRDYTLVTVLAYTGIRISECINLYVEDVSLGEREITVRSTKTGQTRIAYIGDRVVNALRDYLTERGNKRSPYLFVDERGRQLAYNDVKKMLRSISDELAPSTLRVLFSAAADDCGFSKSEVADQLGSRISEFPSKDNAPDPKRIKEKASYLGHESDGRKGENVRGDT